MAISRRFERPFGASEGRSEVALLGSSLRWFEYGVQRVLGDERQRLNVLCHVVVVLCSHLSTVESERDDYQRRIV